MIDLYGMSSPNVTKVILALEELSLPYTFHHVQVWRGEQFEPGFQALNPNGKVPVIVDSEGPQGRPYTVFESGAILVYLAEKTGKLLAASGEARYEALKWLAFQVAGIGPIFGQYVHFTRFEPEVSDYARARYTSEAVRLIDVVDRHLGTVRYMGGEEYSIADIALYPWAERLAPLNLPTQGRENVLRWVDDVGARPAAMRTRDVSLRIREESEASRLQATPEDLDRIFGRGAFARAD